MTAIVITRNGQPVHVPATIEDVRAQLPEEQRVPFTRAAEQTDSADLLGLFSDWLMDHDPEGNATLERLRSGDFSGFTSQDDFLRARGLNPADYNRTEATA